MSVARKLSSKIIHSKNYKAIMKKTYLSPDVDILDVMMEAGLLQASGESLEVFDEEDPIADPDKILSGGGIDVFSFIH